MSHSNGILRCRSLLYQKYNRSCFIYTNTNISYIMEMTTSIVVDKISINVSGIHSNINLCLNIKCKNYWIKNISANKVIVLHKIKQINGEASSTVYYRTMDIHLTENETRWWRSYIQLRVKFIRHFYDILELIKFYFILKKKERKNGLYSKITNRAIRLTRCY